MLELALPPFEKCSFRERRCSVDRTEEMRERPRGITSSTVELAPGRVPQVMTDKPRRRLATLERSDSCFSAFPLCDRDRAIQTIERRRCDAIERRIELRNLGPRRFLVGRSQTVLDRDRSFDVIAREPIPACRAAQVRYTIFDERSMPSRAVLLFHQQEPSDAVETGIEPGCVEVHERQERVGLWDCSDRMLDDHARQPNRLVAQLAPNHAVWLRGAVSLAEEQIEHLENARNALFELGQRGHVEPVPRSRSRARA